ncbi:MAG: MG2 domain-containing protein [Bacteroidota bacterium]
MKSAKVKYLALAAIVAACLAIVYYKTDAFKNLKSGSSSEGPVNRIDPEFAAYISSFTSGYISSNSAIRIKFSREFAGSTQLNTTLPEKYFSFDPKIEGEAVWKDAETMEFIPKERLQPGQLYKATFHLGKLIEVKKELRDFEFRFQVIEQSVQLQANDLKCYNSNDFEYYSLAGNLSTADFADQKLVENLLTAKLNNKTMNLKWLHDEAGTTHQFLIDSIERPAAGEGQLVLNCDGKALHTSYTSSQSFVVPARDNFVLLNVKMIPGSDPYILLNFSNPIDQMQSLEGLIAIGGLSEMKYIVTNNQVMLYPSNTRTGSYILKVDAGVKDTRGRRLDKDSEHSIVFSQVNPEVRFSGKGNIMPSANGLKLAFETVNLRAVDVKVVKIYENNILQFLQVNSMEGSYQLAQVGKKILQKRINLGITNPADFGTWKKFSLDLGSLIKSESGAIYRVSLSIKKSYATYPCAGNSGNTASDMEEIAEEEEEQDINYFGYYDEENSYYDYEYEEGEDYRWEDRDNPCKAYYYRQSERTVSKNILASDLGLTLKKGNDGSLFIAANDIISTKPLGNVNIELYDYQKQLIQTTSTNSDGQAFITPLQKVYFVVARKEKQFAYLRVDDGAALSLSMYDVSGDAIKKGVKGFIYGERGVWRPGDSLFLNFILEDKLGSIPVNHPVTFELKNPQGQLYKRLVSNKNIDGFYNFTTHTDKNAPTGLWNVEVKVGSLKFYKSVRIETIMPNRLKIDVNIGDNKLIAGSKVNTIHLHTNWLTGAKAGGLTANINVALSQGKTEFAKYKDYVFDDRTLKFEAQNVTVFDGKVNEEGNASVPLDLAGQKNAPGFLKAVFNTMVFEPGGAFSVDRFSLDYSPYGFYAGIKLPEGEKNSGILYTGKDHYIDIATVDYKGNPASRPNLKFELYKLEWRWWWDQYNNELANYASDEYHKPVQSETFSTKNGMAKIRVNIRENDWGRYLVRVTDPDGGHTSSTVTYFDWANWMERNSSGDSKSMSNMLSFSADKAFYKTGEEVKINIPTPQNGRALLTIENGSKVLEAHWLETEKGNTVFKFKVTPQMAPNIYVHVSLMQPHSRSNDLPIRSYGVVPVNIDDPETHLQPAISMAGILEPEANADITVSEANSKEMAFTLAVVEEGLLDITRFKTPDPHKTFYTKEALGVKTWDVYDNVIGAFGADLERILSIGGDGSELGKDGAKANRFKPVIRFFGPYHLSKGEKKSFRFKMPMYVGSVRTMVIAGYKGAYGFAEKSTPVKAPLMVLGTLPRVLSITEEVKLPVSVFGGEKNIGATTVKVEVNGLLQTVGGNSKTLNINKNEEKLAMFDLKVKNQTGVARVKITVTGGGHTAGYEMELDVRNPNPYQTVNKDLWVDAGKSIQENIKAIGLAGSNSGVLELSTIPPINLEERLHYLITYPHGCIEQTTSQSFAQLYLPDVMELSASRKSDIENNIKRGISELRKFQLSSGGMSYWPGMNEVSDWGTTYAGHFLFSAEKKGYALPLGFKKEWVSYEQNVAQDFEVNKEKYFNNDVQQAYRLYVLSLAGHPAMSAMNRLREYKSLSQQARWLLASAYALAGQADEAQKIASATSGQIVPYRVDYYTYGSSDRDMAIILEALCLMNKKTQAFEQLKKVSAFLSTGSWLSTQTTAFGLVSVAGFIKKYGSSSAMQAKCLVNGKEMALPGSAVISQVPIDFKNGTGASFSVHNNGKGVLYVKVVNRGKPPIGEEKEASENISVSAVYKDAAGNPIDPQELVQGNNFLLSVTVKNMGAMGALKNLALTNYIPSGWEIHNARMDENEAAMKNSSFTYQDIRDDKVLTYFDLSNNESKTFNIMLNASYEGRYYLPAVNVEAMYDNNVYARTKGQWIRVVKQNASGAAGKQAK